MARQSQSIFGRRAQRDRDGLDDQVRTRKVPSRPIDGSNEPESEVLRGDEESDELKPHHDHTHRRLKPRHIQLIGIGGSVGTVLFVQIGRALIQGGPGSLFIAFVFWCTVVLGVTISLAEMVTYLPISSPFIRFSGRYVDEALGVATGYNFFFFEAALVPFEIVACNIIIHFWSGSFIVPTGAMVAIVVVLYGMINIFAVKAYGESEFWLALGKVVLMIGLVLYTIITMLGGNPSHDRFGFRYWRNPGSFAGYYPGPFAEYHKTGSLGHFLGFLQCLIQATFTIAGPDYVSMAAGETENPRVVLPKVYNQVFYRLMAFYVLGSLAVGINVPYNNPDLSDAFDKGLPGAKASPYVIAMGMFHIRVLPDIVNALILTAAFSAGSSYTYCASRSLYGLALEKKAPRFLTRCTKSGVPIYCVLVVLAISCISFLQVSSGSAQVLNWIINFVTPLQLIEYSMICYTYLRFRKACLAQGLSRDSLPYKGWGQPYMAWYGLIACGIMTFADGYAVFVPGNWDVPTFLFSYLMIGVFVVLYFGWKVLKKTKFLKPEEVDLRSGVKEIEEYTRDYVPLAARESNDDDDDDEDNYDEDNYVEDDDDDDDADEYV